MGLLPQLVGDVEIRTRRPRYPGEPTYKRCSFVRPKHQTTTTETWELIAPQQQNFWEHPQWQFLSFEQQQAILDQYRQTGRQPLFQHHHVIQPQHHHQQQQLHHHHLQQHGLPPPPPHHGHHHQLRFQPDVELIEPKRGKGKKSKKTRPDRGHDIFDSDSDSDSKSSRSSSSLYTYSSGKSSRSSSSSSSTSTLRPLRGWN